MSKRNYFALGQPVFGHNFFGRSRELGKIFSLLQAGSAVNFFSLRRMGKTSLLMQIRYLSENDRSWRQYEPILLDLDTLSPKESIADHLIWKLSIGKGKQVKSHAWREIEKYIRDLPGQPLLLIDEVGHWLQSENHERDLANLRALQQSRLLNVVASTAYIPIIEQIKHHSELVSPFHNIFYSFRLPSFMPAEAVELLITLCDTGGVALNEDLAKELAHYVGYYPNLVQEIGHIAFLRISAGERVTFEEITGQWLRERGREWLQTIIPSFQWKLEDSLSASLQVDEKDFLVESLEAYGILLRDDVGTLKIAPYLRNLLNAYKTTDEILNGLQSLADLDSYQTSKKMREKNSRAPSLGTIFIEKGEVTMGDKFIAGDNIGGIQNIGKFNHVISNLNTTGQEELANTLTELKEAIMASKHLADDKKKEHVEVVTSIGEEATKENPNRTMLKMLGNGLITALKLIPDVAKAAMALAPLIDKLA